MTHELNLYNTTPRSTVFGSPTSLWTSSPSVWSLLRADAHQLWTNANSRLQSARVRRHYQVGQSVWVLDFIRAISFGNKFRPIWIGPCELLAQFSRCVWRIRFPNGITWSVHSDALRPYFP